MTEAERSSARSCDDQGLSRLDDALASFEEDPYEQLHSAALALLPRPRYRSGLQIGCASRALTEQLARRCAGLLAVDRCEIALSAARQRSAPLPQVQFQLMRVPEEYPLALFDLTVVSQAAYQWSRDDVRIAQRRIVAHLESGGHLLLIHHAAQPDLRAPDADALYDAFIQQTQPMLRHLSSLRESSHRIDLFERV